MSALYRTGLSQDDPPKITLDYIKFNAKKESTSSSTLATRLSLLTQMLELGAAKENHTTTRNKRQPLNDGRQSIHLSHTKPDGNLACDQSYLALIS